MAWSVCSCCSTAVVEPSVKAVVLEKPQNLIDLLMEKKPTGVIKKYINSHFDCYDDVDEDKVTALMWAARNNEYDVVKRLLGMGANIDAIDAEGQNVMFYAIKNNNAELNKLLLDKGGNIHQININEETLLHIACELELVDVALWLIESGINFNAKDAHGIHPIDRVCDPDNIEQIQNGIDKKLEYQDSMGEKLHPRPHIPSGGNDVQSLNALTPSLLAPLSPATSLGTGSGMRSLCSSSSAPPLYHHKMSAPIVDEFVIL